ncbi:MAG: hypothetical protein IK031_07455 [Bacteroidales bacterium]|nr:hypothetical protein [Bacteroidales bacterium]
MKKSLIIAAIFGAALAVSCQNKELVEQPVEKQPVIKSFTLQLPDTKASVSLGGKVSWEAGDEILVHTGHIRKGEYTIVKLNASDISSDGKTAKIAFEELKTYDWVANEWTTEPGKYSDYYAAYPAMPTAYPNTWYCRSYFTDTNNFLMAACDNDGVFSFYSLCSIITFSASGDFDSFVFSGNGDETIGYDIYGVEILNGGQDFRYKESSGPLTKIEAKFNKGATNYIYIPGGVNLSGGFTIKFLKNGNVVKVAKSTAGADLARTSMLNLGDISSHVKDYTAPVTSDHKSSIPTSGATDLSAKGSANCYIVPSAGTYKFPANKGNSSELAGQVFGVEIIWESWNNAEEVTENSVIAKVDFENNWIYFQTPSPLKPGNAVIAAKNSNDKIIWSWHIWVPQTAITTASFNGAFGADAMKRDLGALIDPVGSSSTPETVASCGLLYQWGRKDPFPSVGVMATSTSAATTSKPLASISNVQIAIAESIANPTVFAYNGETANEENDWKGMNWTTDDNTNAWDNSGAKGLYDPCPPGYKVPAYDSSLPAWTADGWTYSDTNFWYKLGDLVFPFSGYRDDCSGSWSHAADRAAVWSATSSDANKATCLDVRIKNAALSLAVTGKYKARGNSVRCIVE